MKRRMQQQQAGPRSGRSLSSSSSSDEARAAHEQQQQQQEQQQQQQQQQEQYLLMADPYLLRFAPELEERYQQELSAWCSTHVDLPAAVVVAAMALVGVAYTAANGMTDCVWGITGASLLSASSQLLLLLAAGRRLRGSWRARAAVFAAFRLMESCVTVGFNNGCRTFWDLSARRFTQSLFWDTGAGQLLISAAFKPLPLRHAVAVQAASWAATTAASVRPWCGRYVESDFHAPLLQHAYVLLTPLNLGVDFGVPGAVPSARCCCVPVVLLTTFLVGLVVPLALAHAADYAMRSRFARRTGVGRLLPWPWAVEVAGGMIGYSFFYLVVVAAATSWSCPLPQL